MQPAPATVAARAISRLVQHALLAPGALEHFLAPPLLDAGGVNGGAGSWHAVGASGAGGVASDAALLRSVIPEQWYLGDRRELEEVPAGQSWQSW